MRTHRVTFAAHTLLLLLFLFGCLAEDGTGQLTPAQRTLPATVAPTPPPSRLPTLAPAFPKGAAPANITAEVVALRGEPAGIHRPSVLRVEVAGWNMTDIRWIVAQQADLGLRLFAFQEAADDMQGESERQGIPDGVLELGHVWPGTAVYLTNGQEGEFVIAWPSSENPALKIISGSLANGTSSLLIPSNLVVDARSGLAVRLVEPETGSLVESVPGATFSPDLHWLDEAGQLVKTSGEGLELGEGLQLGLEERPLPAGTYAIGYRILDQSGGTRLTLDEIQVSSEGMDASLRAFVDPALGFRVLLPVGWSQEVAEDGRFRAVDAAGAITLAITTIPEAQGISAAGLAERVINEYGAVQIRYQDEVSMGGLRAQWTAYAYGQGSGVRQGVLVAAVRSGLGYAIDLEGPADSQISLLETVNLIVETWAFEDLGDPDGHWLELDLGTIRVSAPARSVYRRLADGWHQLADLTNGSITSILWLPADGSSADARAAWLSTLGSQQVVLGMSEPYPFNVGGSTWERVDFRYTRQSGGVAKGMLLTGEAALAGTLLWAEAPEASFLAIEQNIFFPMAADIQRIDITDPAIGD